MTPAPAYWYALFYSLTWDMVAVVASLAIPAGVAVCLFPNEIAGMIDPARGSRSARAVFIAWLVLTVTFGAIGVVSIFAAELID